MPCHIFLELFKGIFNHGFPNKNFSLHNFTVLLLLVFSLFQESYLLFSQH
jgi:hypothetical protein